jgi:hypothetical protein
LPHGGHVRGAELFAESVGKSRSTPPRAGHRVDLIRLSLCCRENAILGGEQAIPGRLLAVAGSTVAVGRRFVP